jgi:S-adenosylmethionine/arginine decarboxylase-like enzyme
MGVPEDRIPLMAEIDVIYDLLARIPGLVGIKGLSSPFVVKATDITADGITGFILLTTSHASIHTWTTGERRGKINLDVFSCRDFSEEKIIDMINKIFGLCH